MQRSRKGNIAPLELCSLCFQDPNAQWKVLETHTLKEWWGELPDQRVIYLPEYDYMVPNFVRISHAGGKTSCLSGPVLVIRSDFRQALTFFIISSKAAKS